VANYPTFVAADDLRHHVPSKQSTGKFQRMKQLGPELRIFRKQDFFAPELVYKNKGRGKTPRAPPSDDDDDVMVVEELSSRKCHVPLL
jgi:hypothetical protein